MGRTPRIEGMSRTTPRIEDMARTMTLPRVTDLGCWTPKPFLSRLDHFLTLLAGSK
jgi:hypothetical protein